MAAGGGPQFKRDRNQVAEPEPFTPPTHIPAPRLPLRDLDGTARLSEVGKVD